MMTQGIVLALGWIFLLTSMFWPAKKWGGYAMKMAFSALSFGIFLTSMIYTFL